MDEEYKRIFITELQFLQRQINFWQKANEPFHEPSLERAIEIMRKSQDKLYSLLSQHGVTAEDMYEVIMENNVKARIKEIKQLHKSKKTVKKQLAIPDKSPEKIQLYSYSEIFA